MSEKILVRWYCPKCCDWWAESELEIGEIDTMLNPKDFKMRKDYEKHKVTEDVMCPKCGHVYERMDIYLNIAKALYPNDFKEYPKRKV